MQIGPFDLFFDIVLLALGALTDRTALSSSNQWHVVICLLIGLVFEQCKQFRLQFVNGRLRIVDLNRTAIRVGYQAEHIIN